MPPESALDYFEAKLQRMGDEAAERDEYEAMWFRALNHPSLPLDVVTNIGKAYLEIRRLRAELGRRENRGALELLAVLVEKAGGRVLLEDRLMRTLDRKVLVSYRDERQGGTVYEVKDP